VIDEVDHALIIPSDLAASVLLPLRETYSKVVVVDYQPTSENLLVDFAGRIRKVLPPGVMLCYMKLRETESSFAEWFAG
jgi:6-pyruvoyltetrahydropterin/6-carboxytetrahydropterin synthase